MIRTISASDVHPGVQRTFDRTMKWIDGDLERGYKEILRYMPKDGLFPMEAFKGAMLSRAAFEGTHFGNRELFVRCFKDNYEHAEKLLDEHFDTLLRGGEPIE